MTTQTINIQLSDDIYRRLHDMAAATDRSLEDVLVQTIRGNLPPTLDDLPAEQRNLVADLERLNDKALWNIVKEPPPTQSWRQHQRLLRKAEDGALTHVERAKLAELRETTDRSVIRRSYALALLKWRGHAVPAMP